MIRLTTVVDVQGLSGEQVTDFMLNCDDEKYRKWWDGTHLQFHTIKRCPDNIGNVVYMDEYVGKRRLKMQAIVLKAAPGKEIVWQMKKIVRLPGWLSLAVEDTEDGVRITHTLTAGFNGIGKLQGDFIALFHWNDVAGGEPGTLNDADRIYPGDGVLPPGHLTWYRRMVRERAGKV